MNSNRYNKLQLIDDISYYEEFLKGCISNSNILIIGGAGSIGSSYIRNVLEYKPAALTVVDTNENGLTELTRDLRGSNLLDYNPVYTSYPMDLLSDTFNKVFHSRKWDIIANFSAHKHVRSEKDSISVEALIKNNVFGIIKLLKLCDQYPPKYFFSVSTDKAANPVNIMGASKSLMEKLILSMKNRFRVSTARFANVAFSNGSLLDGFNYRYMKSQALSCPSNIKRYFVTEQQSGQICLLATFLGNSGSIFFPKLNFNDDQIYFKDLALEFLGERGLKPIYVGSEAEAKAYSISKNPGFYPIFLFESDTSGEKEYEEFYSQNDVVNLDNFDSLGVISSADTCLDFDEVIENFEAAFTYGEDAKQYVIYTLKNYVPEFNHIERGLNLDQKM